MFNDSIIIFTPLYLSTNGKKERGSTQVTIISVTFVYEVESQDSAVERMSHAGKEPSDILGLLIQEFR